MKAISRTLAVALAVFAAVASQASARVLIYKGSLRAVSDANTAFPKSFQLLEVFDPESSTTASVTLLESGGQKILLASSVSDIRFAQAPLTNGKSATVISLVISNGSSNEFFENIGIHFRGTNNTLKFRSGLADNFVSFPRVLVGTVFDDEAFNRQGSFIEQRVLMSFQQDRTVIANDGNQTIQQALDSLVAEFQGKGFEAPGQ